MRRGRAVVFDGKANKITVTNRSTLDNHDITVSLSYREFNDSDITPDNGLEKVTGVNMALGSGSDWSGSLNRYEKSIAAGTSSTVYVQFSGEPRMVDGGGKYFSLAMNPVGLIVVRIESWQ